MRHAEGGWLQGYITVTTFTTWTPEFVWDSKHLHSGMIAAARQKSGSVDRDGSLARALQHDVDAAGDWRAEGRIHARVAELALVSGLGCGTWPLRSRSSSSEACNAMTTGSSGLK